tara:strand:+ start:423 stop:1583 length:1161 start_codon:yes stop_codon:yes gene_type:complete
MKIYTLLQESQGIDSLFDNVKIRGGAHLSVLNQIIALQELGHEVRLCILKGNVKHELVDNYQKDLNFPSTEPHGKKFYHDHKKILPKYLKTKVKKFNPDLIISQDYKNWYYKDLSYEYPFLCMVHAAPAYIQDLRRGIEYDDLQKIGHKIATPSNYAKEKFIRFYTQPRKEKIPHIIPDYVLYPSSFKKMKIRPQTNKVFHASRACAEKQTFLIAEYLKDTNFDNIICTQSRSNPPNEKNDKYLKSNLTKYMDSVSLDLPHTDIMKKLETCGATFVGLANYDTFTITSLESLSRGVPLLVKNKYDLEHPAMEMVDKQMKRYVYPFKDKEDFINKVEEFLNITLEERQKIADSCYEKMGWDSFKKTWNHAVMETVESFKERKNVRFF